MLLKRHYDPASLKAWTKELDKAVESPLAALIDAGLGKGEARKVVNQKYADEHDLPTVTHVDIQRSSQEWHPGSNLIERAVQEGWLSLSGGSMTISTGPDDDDVVFKIIRSPGIYCCHCDAKLGSAQEAASHVERHNVYSPDTNNPSGWRTAKHYECVMEKSSA